MWVKHPGQPAPMLVDDATLPYWRGLGFVEWEPDGAAGGLDDAGLAALVRDDASATAGALRAAYGSQTGWHVVTDYWQDGDIGWAAATQRAHDACVPGGTVYFPQRATNYDFEATVVVSQTVAFIGAGAQSAGDPISVASPSRIIGPAGAPAFRLHDSRPANPHIHQGAHFERMHISSKDGTGTGFLINDLNNAVFRDVTVWGYTAGTGWHFETTGPGQYTLLDNCRAHKCQVGVRSINYNGVDINGGYFDGNDNNGQILPGSTAVLITDAGSDTWRIRNLRIQYYETGIDTAGIDTEIVGGRFEGFTNAVIFRGSRGVVSGGFFTNFVLGQGEVGRCVTVTAAADRTKVQPFTYANVAPEPVVDQSVSTARFDGIRVDRLLGSYSTNGAGDTIAFLTNLNGVDAYKVRSCKFQTGDTAVPASATDYWSLTLKRRGGGSADVQTITSQGGWGAYSVQIIDPLAAGGSDQTFQPGDRLHITMTRVGNPPNLTLPSMHLLLVPR